MAGQKKSVSKKINKAPSHRARAASRFFHDVATCDFLRSDIFPLLLQKRSTRPLIRIWVPNCSTGEEVYSLAICLLEFLNKRGANVPLQIFATDPDESVVKSTRTGIYPETIASDVPIPILRRYFAKVDKGYQVRKPVRDLCVFAPHNLIGDPPISRIDFVSCSNVKALPPRLQDRAISLLHYALNAGGFLLGDSAMKSTMQSVLFSQVHPDIYVFRKNPVEHHSAFSSTLRRQALNAFHTLAKEEKRSKHRKPAGRAERRLHEEFDVLRHNLQAMFEEQEQVNGQLQTSNEEIVSNSEELHAINSELESAKEELRSTNDGLVSALDEVRGQLIEDTRQLRALNNEMDSVLAGVDFPVLLLGADLCIRRYSMPAKHLLNLIPTDIGRPITDLKSLDFPNLEVAVDEAIAKLQPREFQTRNAENREYCVRVRPCRAGDNRVDGVVMTILPADSSHEAET